MRRGLRGRTRLAVALGVLAGTIAALPASASCRNHERLDDGWLRVQGPPYSTNPIRAFDAADYSTAALVVTDSLGVSSSADGGCSWRRGVLPTETLVPGAPEDSPQPPTVRLRDVRFGPASSQVVWATAEVDAVVRTGTVTQPRVYLSGDGGVTFQPRNDGLPAFGQPHALRGVAGTTALLLVQSNVPSSERTIYLTTGTGAWQPLWTDLPQIRDLAVDVATPGGPWVWAWSDVALYRARLGDPVLSQVPGTVGFVHSVHAARTRAGSVVTVFLRAPERLVSEDGGRTFLRKPAPSGIESVSGQPFVPGMHVFGTWEARVLVETPVRPDGVDVSPDGPAVFAPQFVGLRHPEGFPVYARDDRHLYLRYVPLDPGLRPAPIDVDLHPPPPPPPPKVGIHPRHEVVRLRPGERRVVDYTVHVPPIPSPLDVYFMTDSTASMGTTISAVADGVQEIVDRLAWRGIDVWLGAADFRDHSSGDPNTYPYRRRRAVGPVDEELARALEGITTAGGGPQGHHAGLEAIYQAVTGAGRTDPLVLNSELIPPGQDAEFRDDAMKVVLVATDDNFRHPGPSNPGYPGPAIDTVSRVLKEHGVYLVGLEVETDSGSARADMERLARDSNALAPAGGVDCDEDGVADVKAGDPLVCTFVPEDSASIASAFVEMVAGIREPATVEVAVTGVSEFVRAIGPVAFPDVNVREPHTLRLPVEFRCTAGNAGTERQVRISARTRGSEFATATATLVCAAPGGRAPEPPVPPEYRAPLGRPLPAAPVLPAAQQPPPGQSNPNPHPQPNANSAFAAQEDEEFEVATANDEGSVVDDELAMTGLRSAVPPQPAVAWALAVAMTGAAAFGLHHRRQVRTGLAHAPPEPR